VETDLLRTFTAVVRTGSFTAAARELGYVQSTVTGHLQALERRLGTRLLDRLSSGAVPTNAGARLLPYAEQLLDLETRIATDVPYGDDRPVGDVRLGRVAQVNAVTCGMVRVCHVMRCSPRISGLG